MGAGTITITNAFFLGSILETLGSVFLSGEVNHDMFSLVLLAPKGALIVIVCH